MIMEENEKHLDNHNQNGKPMEHVLRVHESKSRPGWKYCYNPETKQSMWICCDVQVDKAKLNKNSTQNQPIFNETHCSEAKANQPNFVTNESDGPSKIYKKEVINNQLPNKNCNIPVFENEEKIYNPINFINTVPVNISAIPAYKRDIWNVPSGTQLIVTPAVTPLINQPQILLDQSQVFIPVGYNNLPHNILTPAVRDLKNDSVNIGHGTLQGFNSMPYKVNCGVKRRPIMHRKFYRKRKDDLRNILSSKEYYMTHDSNIHSNNEDEETVRHSQKKKVCNIASTYQNNQGIQKYLETSQRFDLNVIRELSTSNANLDEWYIVADRTVIQENFNFLNNLIDSDNRCRIMVPQSVFTELRTLADDHNAVNIRRIFRFICKEIESGRRWKGDNLNTEQNLSTFEVCLKLSSENYHVVLVSSDKECLKLKNTTEIPIFTIQEFKNLLTNSNTLNEPTKTKFFAERIISVVNNEQRNNSETSSKILSGQSLIDQHSCLSESSNIDVQANIVKENSNVMPENDVDIAKIPEEFQPVLGAEENGMDKAHSNVDGPSIVNNTNTPSVSYTKRVIKLKQNQSNQKQFNSTKKGWSNRKRTIGDKNISLASTDTPISTKQSNMEQKTSDEFVDVIECKHTANSVDLSCDTSECRNNENNSESCTPLKKMRNNVVIDESASLISTAESAFVSESVDRNQQISRFDPDEPNIKVIFEITDKNMEENLTMRCDEWVSRFVQIMEEVLSQVLHQEPPFISDELPPPWILQEAAQCIIKKYSHCFYVVDAANNLSIIIHKLSDISGKIVMPMKPTDFMKMYSFGLYLVKALMNECKNCEDLYNARESLQKLLHDIQNQDIDCPNDSFNNTLQELTMVEQVVSRPSLDVIEDSNTTIVERLRKNSVARHDVQSNERNLQESEKNLLEKNDDQEISFLSNLELQKSLYSSINNLIDSSEQATATTLQHDGNENESQVKNSPKIIRQFNKCVEYENRLKNLKSKSMEWDADSFDSNDEYSEDNYGGENHDSDDNINRGEETESENTIGDVEDNMIRFRCFIGLFVNEIKETFTQVHTLCKNIIESECKQSNLDNKKVYKKAEKAHLYIDKLSKSLESILNREAENPDKDIQTLMKKAGVHISFDQRLTNEYKSIISKCMDQAKEYLSYLNTVITLNKDTIVS